MVFMKDRRPGIFWTFCVFFTIFTILFCISIALPYWGEGEIPNSAITNKYYFGMYLKCGDTTFVSGCCSWDDNSGGCSGALGLDGAYFYKTIWDSSAKADRIKASAAFLIIGIIVFGIAFICLCSTWCCCGTETKCMNWVGIGILTAGLASLWLAEFVFEGGNAKDDLVKEVADKDSSLYWSDSGTSVTNGGGRDYKRGGISALMITTCVLTSVGMILPCYYNFTTSDAEITGTGNAGQTAPATSGPTAAV